MTTARKTATSIIATLAVLALFTLATWQLTLGFEQWTFEDKRIAQANAGQIHAPATRLADTHGSVATYWPGRGRETVYLVDFIYTRCPLDCW